MPANAKPAKYPSRLYNIVLRITGKEKNRILKEANKQNLSLSEYIKYAVWVTMRNEQGIPPPTTTKIELPTPDAHLRAYLRGETLLQPCGEVKCDMVVESFGVMRVCATCNLRLD
jgi:hypothetical protein